MHPLYLNVILYFSGVGARLYMLKFSIVVCKVTGGEGVIGRQGAPLSDPQRQDIRTASDPLQWFEACASSGVRQ